MTTLRVPGRCPSHPASVCGVGGQQQLRLGRGPDPHRYTPKLCRAIFTWFNTHLKNDSTTVTDDVTDFVEPEENLLVFGGKLPQQDEMHRIDELLVKRADLPVVEDEAAWRRHQQEAIKRLREIAFRYTLTDHVLQTRDFRADGSKSSGTLATYVFDSFDGMTIGIMTKRPVKARRSISTLAFAVSPDERRTFGGGGASRPRVHSEFMTVAIEVRNMAAPSVGPRYLWTAGRTYPLLGETLPERQVSDLLAAIGLLRREPVTGTVAVAVYGRGYTAPLAIYAALLDPKITESVLADPPTSHKDPNTPEFLGMLRAGNLAYNLALAYPRTITFVGTIPEAFTWTRELYQELGAGDRIRVIPSMQDWTAAERKAG